MKRTDVGGALAAACAALALLAGCGVGPKEKDYKQYAVSSSFNVQTRFDDGSAVGLVLNLVNGLGDEPDDPGKFIVEQLIGFLPGPLRLAAEPLTAELGRLVNAKLLAAIPGLVDEVKQFSQALASVVRVFRVDSVLDVGLDARDRYTASHALTRVTYSYDGAQLAVAGPELGPVAVPAQIWVDYQGDVLRVGEHELPLSLGSIVAKGVDRLVIPRVAKSCPTCLNYVELITWWFSCAAIAADVAERIDPRNVDTAIPIVLTACQESSHGFSSKLTEMIARLDQHGGFTLRGTATASGDRATLSNGRWLGEYRLGRDVRADLADGNTFEGVELVKP